MLKIQNQEHYDRVIEFAEKAGRMEQLQERLDYLDTYAEHGDRGKTQCVLGYDWAPYSFNFTMLVRGDNGEYKHWFNGGLIFHGQHDNGGDGSSPTFAVCLNPTDGWSIHT